MLDLLILGAMVFSAFGLGQLGISVLAVPLTGAAEKIPFTIAMGWAILSMILFGVGLLGWLNLWVVWGIVGISALVGLGVVYRLLWFELPPARWFAGRSVLEVLLVLALLVLILLGLFMSLVPCCAVIDGTGAWDGLSYHLTMPKLYIEHGAIVPIPYMVYSTYPMGWHLLFIPGLMVERTAFAALLHMTLGILTAVAVANLAARFAQRHVALLTVGVFLAIPLVRNEMTWPSNDLAVVFYTGLAVVATVRWRSDRQLRWLILAGLMAGFALSVKLTALLPIGALGLIVCFLVIKAEPRRVSAWVAPFLAFGVPFLLVGAPWYLRNFLTVGNPFMPYFYSLFGGANWSPEAAERLRLHLESFGLTRFTVPSFVFPVAAVGAGLLALIVAFWSKLSDVVRVLLLYVLLSLALWLVSGSTQQRFLLPAYPFIVLMIFWGVAHFIRLRYARSALYVLVTLVVLISFGRKFMWARLDERVPVILGQETPSAFLGQQLYHYPAYEYANRELPASSVVFIFPENRTFYLEHPYIWGDPYSQALIEYDGYASPVDFMERLHSLGVTHVIVHRQAYSYWRQMAGHDPMLVDYVEHAIALVDGLESFGAQDIYAANDVFIYELPRTASAQP